MDDVYVLWVENEFYKDEIIGVYKEKQNALKRMKESDTSSKEQGYRYTYRVEKHKFRD